ncbi:MAG: glycine betaine ABC transporter substrate-binding protein [Candidatus Limivicinus sp.]|jgi:osmoprotectant transport system permease protein
MSWNLVLEHLFIVIASGMLSVILGLPLGILAYVYPKARKIILRVVDLLQTIPSLALLGIIMVVLSPGKLTVILGITLYSLLPIVRNTCLGFQQVDPGIKEAARGMGMTRLYRIFVVEFPLAFPTIFTGIRISIVNAIGTAVFAAYVGGGGLGKVITQGIRVADMSLILSATGVLMVIAALLDLLMGWIEKQMRNIKGSHKKPWIPLAAIFAAFLLLLPAVREDKSGLMLYDGDYSETQLMHHMVKMLVEDRTDLDVTIQDQMSQVNNYKSMLGSGHTCDLMISYDGTVLTTFLGQDVTDVPEGSTLYDYVNQEAGKDDLRLLEKLGFDNTYAVAVPEDIAEKYHLETVSDLVPVAGELRFGAEQGFFSREGTMKFYPFAEFYGLNFKSAVPVDIGLKYTAISNGSFDVTVVYATDGLNRKAKLKILEDDRHFFPDYNGAFLVRNDCFERFKDEAPELEDVLNELAGMISTERMSELTYEVDVMGRTVDEVAEEFLVGAGLL